MKTVTGMTRTITGGAASASRSLRSGAPHRAPRERGAPVGVRQFEGHRSAAAGSVTDAGMAAVGFGDGLHDRQAQPGPTPVTRRLV